MAERQSILVLPGGMAESERFRQEAEAAGKQVVGASSLEADPARERYKNWIYLPSVHEDGFLPSLKQAIAEEGIYAVYCPHSIIHFALQKLIGAGQLSLELLNPNPGNQDRDRMANLLHSAATIRELMATIAAHKPPGKTSPALPSIHEIAALQLYCNAIVGQSSDEKLAAMLSLFTDLPQGDVVEIGAFWGRSSYLLAWAAQRYQTGKLLAVDPWKADNSIQTSSPDLVQQDTHLQDWNMIHEGFKVAVALFNPGQVNYLRHPSQQAVEHYRAGAAVESAAFGKTAYRGAISLLHIDGNHDYDCVRIDRDCWCPLVQPGGWIVFDDYQWAHGDGPQRAADEFLRDNWSRIARSFVCGKALFVQLATG